MKSIYQGWGFSEFVEDLLVSLNRGPLFLGSSGPQTCTLDLVKLPMYPQESMYVNRDLYKNSFRLKMRILLRYLSSQDLGLRVCSLSSTD